VIVGVSVFLKRDIVRRCLRAEHRVVSDWCGFGFWRGRG